MIKKMTIATLALFLLQAQASDPLKVVREKGFYKTGAAAKNTSFIEWVKKPVFGEESAGVVTTADGNGSKKVQSSGSGGSTFFGLLNSRPIKRNAALEAVRDEGYKEKEARMRAEWEAKQRAARAAEAQKPQTETK
jgi:hypothetical protein